MSYEAGIFNNYQDYHLIHNTHISTIFLPSIIVVFITEFDIFTTIIVVKMFFAEVCLSLFLSFFIFYYGLYYCISPTEFSLGLKQVYYLLFLSYVTHNGT